MDNVDFETPDVERSTPIPSLCSMEGWPGISKSNPLAVSDDISLSFERMSIPPTNGDFSHNAAKGWNKVLRKVGVGSVLKPAAAAVFDALRLPANKEDQDKNFSSILPDSNHYVPEFLNIHFNDIRINRVIKNGIKCDRFN